jgi:hypothetical protein
MTVTVEPTPALLEVLDGVVDLHCHSGPSPFPRRFDHVEASHDGARINMRAILCKSHHHNTVMDLLAMRTQLAGAPTPMYGGVSLNSEVGGIDDGFPSAAGNLYEEEVSVFDDSGEVSEQTHLVTELVAEAGIMLTGGHLDAESMKAFFKTAAANGVRRILLHHPDFIVNASDTDIEEMVGYGAYVEHELSMYHPDVPAPDFTIERLVNWIEKVGPERTVINSDLGQKGNPLPVDAYLYVVQQLLDHGVSAQDVRQMICRNTAFLLGLEETP